MNWKRTHLLWVSKQNDREAHETREVRWTAAVFATNKDKTQLLAIKHRISLQRLLKIKVFITGTLRQEHTDRASERNICHEHSKAIWHHEKNNKFLLIPSALAELSKYLFLWTRGERQQNHLPVVYTLVHPTSSSSTNWRQNSCLMGFKTERPGQRHETRKVRWITAVLATNLIYHSKIISAAVQRPCASPWHWKSATQPLFKAKRSAPILTAGCC